MDAAGTIDNAKGKIQNKAGTTTGTSTDPLAVTLTGTSHVTSHIFAKTLMSTITSPSHGGKTVHSKISAKTATGQTITSLTQAFKDHSKISAKTATGQTSKTITSPTKALEVHKEGIEKRQETVMEMAVRLDGGVANAKREHPAPTGDSSPSASPRPPRHSSSSAALVNFASGGLSRVDEDPPAAKLAREMRDLRQGFDAHHKGLTVMEMAVRRSESFAADVLAENKKLREKNQALETKVADLEQRCLDGVDIEKRLKFLQNKFGCK